MRMRTDTGKGPGAQGARPAAKDVRGRRVWVASRALYNNCVKFPNDEAGAHRSYTWEVTMRIVSQVPEPR